MINYLFNPDKITTLLFRGGFISIPPGTCKEVNSEELTTTGIYSSAIISKQLVVYSDLSDVPLAGSVQTVLNVTSQVSLEEGLDEESLVAFLKSKEEATQESLREKKAAAAAKEPVPYEVSKDPLTGWISGDELKARNEAKAAEVPVEPSLEDNPDSGEDADEVDGDEPDKPARKTRKKKVTTPDPTPEVTD